MLQLCVHSGEKREFSWLIDGAACSSSFTQPTLHCHNASYLLRHQQHAPEALGSTVVRPLSITPMSSNEICDVISAAI